MKLVVGFLYTILLTINFIMIMNKKFSTLMAGFLLTSAFASAQFSIDPSALKQAGAVDKDKKYFVIQDKDGDGAISAADQLLSVTKDGKDLTYAANNFANIGTSGDKREVGNFVWTLKETTDGTVNPVKFYSLLNEAEGVYLTFDISDANAVKVIDNSDNSTAGYNKDKSLVGWFMAAASAGNTALTQNQTWHIYPAGKAFNNALVFNNIDASVDAGASVDNGASTSSATGTKIILCVYKDEQKADIKKMNDTMGGNGFNLALTADKDKYKANNFFEELNLKALDVTSDIALATEKGATIPAGTYLALADELPADFDGVLDSEEEFKAITFVAVDPKTNLDITQADRAEGEGFSFKKMKGSDFFFFNAAGTDKGQSKDAEVYVGNACFTIINPTLGNTDTYQIYTDKARFVKEKGKTEQIGGKKIFVGGIIDQKTDTSTKDDVHYVVTASEGLTFELTNGTLYRPALLLNESDAPAVYNIRFVSGKDEEDSEYGQYLTVSNANSGNFALTSVVDIDPMDPMFQFVVTSVDTVKRIATFTNRQTKVGVEMSLYKSGDAFTVYTTSTPTTGSNGWKLFVEQTDGISGSENEVVTFGSIDLDKTMIKLEPVTVEDKFATFVNRAENAGLVTFALAKNEEATPEFYIGANLDEDGKFDTSDAALRAYEDGLDATQFKLVKNEKDDKFNMVVNPYVFVKDGRVVASDEQDTVAYYTYKVEAFNPDNADKYNFQIGSSNIELKNDGTMNVIVKQNIDGSVSLINVANTTILTNHGAQYIEVSDGTGPFALKNEGKAWKISGNYDLGSKLSGGLKTFIVEESPAVSYEAVPQHVSFAIVRGGFMTMDEDNNARLAIANEASEDLTFWLDTVYSDQQIPSFYITKGGNFMYNSIDSAKYYNNRGNYRYNLENKKYAVDEVVAKLIFKAGELVSSDTLQTTVDNKTVKVAAIDRATKDIKGGLRKFQFQIVRAEEGSDEYVIRQGYDYVCQYNNYFFLDADKDEAYRFVIEKQSAPTANEGIEASEVTVIAGEGNVTIAGAAGKKVVVSNILGQVVANTIITSDNATIAAPAGVVVVAVEGEAAVKAIVK